MNEAIASSVWVTSPEYAGWLQKRGFAWRKLWRRRWIALHGAEIVYMEQEPTLLNTGSIKMTKGQLTYTTRIDPDDLEGNPEGFAIHLNDGKSPTWYLRASTVREKKDWLMRLSHVMAIILWLEDYEKVRVLGLGGTGIVYELLHKSNGKRFALKEIEIKNKAQMQVALQEAEMLKEIMENILHPNIMHIEKVFQVGSKFYLVFPLCTGGELYEHVVRRGRFTERDAALLARSLMSAIHALHSREILHLDIKPENILFESTALNSQIKLTDFGLSKFFSNLETSETAIPSVAEMDRRLQDFAENGVLNTLKLKGTVGYMSPELILTGHTSKCTDIFAAGVVIYILLCGHPPFQSKSNREVLEKTCRGAYRMEGSSWRDVSDAAKDLVRGMLQRDPQKRLTVEQVLEHPWLQEEEEEEADVEEEEEEEERVVEGMDKVLGEAAVGTGEDEEDRPMPFRLSSSSSLGRKGSGARYQNLQGLYRLSEHVAERRSEKFMSGLTNLAAFIQAGAGSGSKLIQFVRRTSGAPAVALTLSSLQAEAEAEKEEEEGVIFLNPYVRQALAGAMTRACDGGKMTIEQFLSVLKKLGIASGLPGMFLCRFVDRDGDGFISADDLFTTQALVMQRSEVFLRVVFRVYSESIWYPGRQLNLVNYYQQQSTPKKAAAGNKVLDEAPAADVIEPPKFITARHVTEVFSKLGYNTDDGKVIFSTLCETLARIQSVERGPSRDGDTGDDEAALAALTATLELERGVDKARARRESNEKMKVVVPPHQPSSPDPSSSEGVALDQPPLAEIDSPMRSSPTSTSSNITTPVAGTQLLTPASLPRHSASTGTQKMDVDDFIRCIEFDDVLIQALLRRPRSGFLELIERAKKTDEERAASGAGAATGAGSNRNSVGGPSIPSALEDELVSALTSAKTEQQPTVPFPIASAVAMGTVSVLQRVQGVVSGIVGSFEGGQSHSRDTDHSRR